MMAPDVGFEGVFITDNDWAQPAAEIKGGRKYKTGLYEEQPIWTANWDNILPSFYPTVKLLQEVFATRKRPERIKRDQPRSELSQDILTVRHQIELAYHSVMSKRAETRNDIVKMDSKTKGAIMRDIVCQVTTDVTSQYDNTGTELPDAESFKGRN